MMVCLVSDTFLFVYEREENIINQGYLYTKISSSIIHIYIIQIIRFEERAVIRLEVYKKNRNLKSFL